MRNIIRILRGLFTAEDVSDDEINLAVFIIALLTIVSVILFLYV